MAQSIDTQTRRAWLGSSELANIIDGTVDHRSTPALGFGQWAHDLIERDINGLPWSIGVGKGKDAGVSSTGVCTLVNSDSIKMENLMTNARPLLSEVRAMHRCFRRVEQSIYCPLDRLDDAPDWASELVEVCRWIGRPPKARADVLLREGRAWVWRDWKTTTHTTLNQMQGELMKRKYLLRGAWHAMAYSCGGWPIKALEWAFLGKSKMRPVVYRVRLDRDFRHVLKLILPKRADLEGQMKKLDNKNRVITVDL